MEKSVPKSEGKAESGLGRVVGQKRGRVRGICAGPLPGKEIAFCYVAGLVGGDGVLRERDGQRQDGGG